MTLELSRRQFLALTAAAGSAALVMPFTWQVLAAQQRRTLLEMARTLFPHDGASDRAYVRAVATIEWRCRHDRAARIVITRGVAELEGACREPFEELPERRRVELLKARRAESFFRLVYAEMLERVYGSADGWTLFANG